MKKLTYASLFSGIGGFELALNSFGFKCVFASEIDKFAKQTYLDNFPDSNLQGDIREINPETIPEFDLLVGGFPCQDFSIAGKQKGFSGERGSLFFEVVRILRAKRPPKYFLLENVKNLKSHNKGETIKIVMNELRSSGYNVFYSILNSKNFNVPQNRERIFIVGFRLDQNIDFFSFPQGSPSTKRLIDILEQNVDSKYDLSDRYLTSLRLREERHKKKGNGFTYKPKNPKTDISGCLSVGGSGLESNLLQINKLESLEDLLNQCENQDPIRIFNYGNTSAKPYLKQNTYTNTLTQNKGMTTFGIQTKTRIRKLTPRECARLQGFPDEFKIDICSNTQLYRQFGNAVTVTVIQAIIQQLIKTINL